jgi:uncharacterized protein (DUF4415 family)
MTRKRRIPEISDEEEAEVQRMIAEDPDDWEATDEEIANAMSFEEAEPELATSILREHPELAEPMRKRTEELRRRRGRPRVEKPRQQVSIRLDPDVIAKFKATGPGWQGRINAILKAAKV